MRGLSFHGGHWRLLSASFHFDFLRLLLRFRTLRQCHRQNAVFEGCFDFVGLNVVG